MRADDDLDFDDYARDYYGRHARPGGAEDTLCLFLRVSILCALCVGAVVAVIALCALVIS